MRRIIPLDLVGNNTLDFDLYNYKGDLIYSSGEALTPDLLIKLCHEKVFVKDNYGNLKHKSVISDNVAKTLVNISKELFKKLSASEKLDISSCKEAADIIFEEVSNNLEKIDCISQLKIFDEYLFSHTINVSTMSSAIGITLGLEETELKELALGALLHDIGKMFVPKEILNKPAKLDEEEFNIMKSHTLLGYKYIVSNTNLPDRVAKVALDHQENYGGGGYPNGLKGKEIDFYAQITAIADVYDALTSNRVYKRAFDSDKAIDIMISEVEERFNPYIFSKFLGLVDYKKEPKIISGNNQAAS